jgi:hypothetical protein
MHTIKLLYKHQTYAQQIPKYSYHLYGGDGDDGSPSSVKTAPRRQQSRWQRARHDRANLRYHLTQLTRRGLIRRVVDHRRTAPLGDSHAEDDVDGDGAVGGTAVGCHLKDVYMTTYKGWSWRDMPIVQGFTFFLKARGRTSAQAQNNLNSVQECAL